MKKEILPTTTLTKLFYAFIFIHVITWTLVPYFVRYTLPMDAMEGAIWGQHFEWGYDKNPFLNGWLTALAVKLSGSSGFTVYLFSQISVAICFWAMWELAKKILHPLYALIAVLLLEGVQYYNLHAIDFNDNTLELALWALMSLYFYQALLSQKTRDWILVGVFSGLGMMTKYYTVMLLLPMFFFLLRAENIASFKSRGMYIGLITFAVIITPHIVWLFFHDFVTVDYALDRVSAQPTWFNHFHYSFSFAQQQFEAFIPPLCLSLILLLGNKPLRDPTILKLSPFNHAFLLYLGLGPFLLTILLSAFTGIHLRAGWGEPLLSFWGILLLVYLKPRMTRAKFYRFLAVFLILLALTLFFYAGALIRARAPSSANFPGRIIAQTLTQEWHQRYKTPLNFIAGSRWLAGNVAFYSTDHPTVYINWDHRVSPWVDLEEFKKEGAIFVWDLDEEKDTTNAILIKQRYESVEPVRILYFSWLRNKAMKPIKIGVAFLPPAR